MKIKTIRELCYELYKIDWLDRHVSSRIQMDNICDFYEYQKEDSSIDTYEEYLDQYGFGYNIFVCFDEFIDSEYKNEEYMAELLGDNENLIKEYKDDLASQHKYYGVSQSSYGHEYRWIFDEETLKKKLETDDVLSMSGEWVGFPFGGSNSSSTWIQQLSDIKEIENFLVAEGDGPDSSDPMLVDIAEYLVSVDTDCDSCTQKFLDILGFKKDEMFYSDDVYGHYASAKSMIEELKNTGYEEFDYDDPFYGENRGMTYSELCDLYNREVKDEVL